MRSCGKTAPLSVFYTGKWSVLTVKNSKGKTVRTVILLLALMVLALALIFALRGSGTETADDTAPESDVLFPTPEPPSHPQTPDGIVLVPEKGGL